MEQRKRNNACSIAFGEIKIKTRDQTREKVMENKKWTFSGFYPFQDKNLPLALSKKYNQPLIQIDDGLVGIILPYPHGFDDDFSLLCMESVQDFLHIFNVGIRRDNFVGVARCVKYETGLLPEMKRISLVLTHPLL